MAMGKLREPFESLVAELSATMQHCRETIENEHSARYRAAMAIVRKYDIKLRPIPLSQVEIDAPPPTCAVCRQPLGDSVVELRTPLEREVYAHPACVNLKRST